MLQHNLQQQDDIVQLYFTAQAFVESAARLTEHLVEGDEEDLYDVTDDTRVILHLAYLGVELYLKAGLAMSGVAYPKSHDVRALRQKYIDGAFAMPLKLPQLLLALLGDVDPELPELTPVPMARHFERYRYTSDREGRPFPPLPAVDLHELLNELRRLQASAMGWLYPVLRGWRQPNGTLVTSGPSNLPPSGT